MPSSRSSSVPSLLRVALLPALAARAWIAVNHAPGGQLDVFQMGDDGAKVKDLLSFSLARGEVVDANALACGRCFCLVLGTDAAARTSTLYNLSFCLVPQPALESALPLPYLAYNLHSNEGEGDGGDGVTLLIDHTTTPQSYFVASVSGAALRRRIDISRYVDLYGGSVYPGGTAFCAETGRLWVAVRTLNRTHDTLLAVDLHAQPPAVAYNISMLKPALALHFADCSTNAVGGFVQTTDRATNVSTVRLGMLAADGSFKQLDAAALPAGSPMRLAPIGAYLHDPRWAASSYGALLYSAPQRLPGLIFVSTGGQGAAATLSPLADAAAAVAVEY